MSLLDTVELQGIRSVGVGPHNVNVIEFLQPLTIISGPNGAGKTTIIEALKYVTTGELPKGSFQTFIHDMRLDGRTRVDASVKLKFKDIKGRSCVVTRRMMQCRGAKGKVTNKSEESTIAIEKEPSEWKSLSSKVVDCKKEVLNLLGLPAAILEYVVFCHQEESSWPLDEPKKLKERFDEIFQVTGYVKAIEVLRKELKENEQELKITEGRLPLLIRQQEEKIKLNNDYIALKKQVTENEKEILLKQKALEEESAKKDEKLAELDEAETLEKKHNMIETEKLMILDQLRCCTASDYENGIEDLKREIELITHSNEYIDAEQDRAKVIKEIEELKAILKGYATKKESTTRVILELRSIQMMRQKMLVERDRCLKEYCTKYLKSEPPNALSQLHDLVERRKEVLKDFKINLEKKQYAFQKEIDGVSENLVQISTKIGMKVEECDRIEKDIATLENDLVGANHSSQQLDVLQNEIAKQEKMLETTLSIDRTEYKIDDLRKKRDAIASKIEVLKKDCSIRENIEEAGIKIKLKNEELIRLEKELNALNNKHQSALSKLFANKGFEYPLCERLTVRARKLAQSLSAVEDELKIHGNELSRGQNAVSLFNRELNNLAEQIASYRRKIMKVVSDENEIEKRLNEVQILLKKSRQDLGRINGCIYLYEQWEEEVLTNKCCPLCEISCSSTDESENLSKKIKQRKKNLPNEAEKLMRKVKDFEEVQNELMELIPYVRLLEKLKTEKEEVQEKLKKEEQKLRDAEEEFLRSRTEKDTIVEEQDVVRGVQTDASLMDSIWKSLSTVKDDIKLLEASLNCGDREGRSLADLQIELCENEAQYRGLISEIDKVQAVASERNKCFEKLSKLKENLTILSEKAMKLDSLNASLDRKKEEFKSCKKDLEDLETRKPIVEQQLQAIKEERSLMQSSCRKEEADLLHSVQEVEVAVKELEKLDEKLMDIADNSVSLKNQEDILAGLETEIGIGDVKIRELTGQLDHLNEKQERKRRLDDQMRKLELQERIKSLEDRLKETEWHGIPISEMRKELHLLSRRVNELQLMIENKRGELKEQKKRLTILKQNLESPEYSQSKEEFKKEVIKKCVTRKVIEDLANYIRVVDESVVKFHAQKMEEINEILGSLWEKVYHGNDIETIRIRSETIDEKEKKKSYNYRVVMSVGGTEIDMPGRCSAGQKMLASILIRIALSDVFCDSCSIIALDEPTTNLDVLKVENLGDMLADIIMARCSNSSKAFQLIVITHDNRFVDHLCQLCRPEWVYAVSKDDSGLSRVKRHRNLIDAAMREE